MLIRRSCKGRKIVDDKQNKIGNKKASKQEPKHAVQHADLETTSTQTKTSEGTQAEAAEGTQAKTNTDTQVEVPTDTQPKSSTKKLADANQPYFVPQGRVNRRLVHDAQKGDAKAIERVIELYYQDMLYYAQKKVGKQDGEDVTQQAISRLITKLGDLKEPAKLKSWLMKSLHYECLDFLRKKKRTNEKEVIVMLDDDFNGNIEDRELPADALLINEENKEQLIQIIDSLPDRFADVIRLRYLEDMSMAEIADVLNIDRKKVYNDIYRGLRLAEERIKEQNGEQRFFAVGAAGAIPILTQALQADLATTASPQLLTAGIMAVQQAASAQLGATSANASTASTTTSAHTASSTSTISISSAHSQAGAATKQASLAAKIAIGSVAFVAVISATLFFTFNQNPASNSTKPTSATSIEPDPAPSQQQMHSINTLADMIGEDQARTLLDFQNAGTDAATWQAFCASLGAQKELTSSENDYQYQSYMLAKQDKQLLLVERQHAQNPGILEVRFRFGMLEDAPNQMVMIHMFDEN